jgi:hypothetical protein
LLILCVMPLIIVAVIAWMVRVSMHSDFANTFCGISCALQYNSVFGSRIAEPRSCC